MQLKISILLLGLSMMLQSVYAQVDQQYTGLKSHGQVPEDFTKKTLEKIADTEMEQLEALSRKEREEFASKINFGIDYILQSGRVCFNDTISNYVSSVLEEIKSYNHDIPSQVRIYTVKSPVVNAYTTDQGIIFINTGLLAQLENEAQLAFILCHELVHYMNNHVRVGYVEDTKIANNQSDYRKTKTIDKQLASAKFSRKMEKEADKLGLKMFLNTPYNPQEVDGVFDVLLYSYLPFDEIPFDTNFLAFGDYEIPTKYILKKINPIEVDENEDDADHTHPNIFKRRELADRIIADSPAGANFILPKEQFYAVRAAARFEVMRLQTVNGNYSEALYSAYLLKKEFPNHPQPDLAIGEILYSTAIYTNNKERKQVTGYYRKKQGEVQQVYFQLNKIPSRELNLIAAKFNFDLTHKYPNNAIIQKRTQHLFTELAYTHLLRFDDLILENQAPKLPASFRLNQADSATQRTQKMESAMSKYDRIKANKQRIKDLDSSADWHLNIFKNTPYAIDLDSYFETAEEQADSIRLVRGETDDQAKNAKIKETRRKAKKRIEKKGYALGLDKIVIVDPYYAVLKSRNKNLKLQKSAKKLSDYVNAMPDVARKAGLDVEILTPFNFDANSTADFNDFSLINEWATERFNMNDKGEIVSLSEEVLDLARRRNTKYFGFTGVVNGTAPRRWRGWVALVSFYTVVGIPFGIIYCVTPKAYTNIYFVLFDVETGKPVMYTERNIPLEDAKGVLKSQYYDIFQQIKK
jgi:hypothetical protein